MLLGAPLQSMEWYLLEVMQETSIIGHNLELEDGPTLTFYPISKKWKLGMVTEIPILKNSEVFLGLFTYPEEIKKTHYLKLL